SNRYSFATTAAGAAVPKVSTSTILGNYNNLSSFTPSPPKTSSSLLAPVSRPAFVPGFFAFPPVSPSKLSASATNPFANTSPSLSSSGTQVPKVPRLNLSSSSSNNNAAASNLTDSNSSNVQTKSPPLSPSDSDDSSINNNGKSST